MAQSSEPTPSGLNGGIYEVLLVWGVLVVAVLIVSFLLLCTPLGHPLKRRILRLRSNSKEDHPNAQGLEAHTFQFRSPQLGTPAPPYEWVISITPPPMAHVSSANHEHHHVSPILSHRFSEIPRAEAGCGLGILLQPEESPSKVKENRTNQAISEPVPVEHRSTSSTSSSSILVSKPSHVSSSRPPLLSETVSIRSLDAPSATEGAVEREHRHDRYGAMLLQSHETARRALLESMPEEDRIHPLIRTSSMTRF